MNRRRVIWVVAVVLLLGASGVTAVILDPAARVQGWANGEPFFQGRSATAWRRDLRSDDEARAASARDALTAGKGDAIPVCVWLLKNAAEAPARWRAADALRDMGSDAAPAAGDLLAALADPDPHVRGAVIRAVAAQAPHVAGAIPALVKLFPDPDAIRAVSAFKHEAIVALPELLPLLNSPVVPVRRQAVRTIGKIGPGAKPAVPELVRLTDSDPEPGVQEQAAEALGDIGPEASAGIPALVRALKHPEAMVRRDAVRALGQMKEAARDALPAVHAMANDPDPRVQEAATRAARLINPAGEKK